MTNNYMLYLKTKKHIAVLLYAKLPNNKIPSKACAE